MDQAAEFKQVAATWQPIETAPRDGTAALVYTPGNNGGQIEIAAWRGLTNGHDAEWRNEDDLMVGRPTHWMPLPAPPAVT